MWESVPARLTLGSEDVHVWRVSVGQNESRIAALKQLLTQQELQRSRRYFFKRDQDRFIVTRGLLRSIIGRYLDRDPAQLSFFCNEYGKPFLEKSENLFFNLSHSRSLALFAFAVGRELGVDVEHVRRDLDVSAIATRFFSKNEVMVLNKVPAHLRVDAFFNCWTRKEAYIKARGRGIYFGLENFDVSLVPGEEALLLRVNGDDNEPPRWSFRILNPHPGYAAAVIAEGKTWRLQCWDCE